MEVTNSSRNVQMSGPLLELCGRRVVVLQKKVPQIALCTQLADNVSEGFIHLLPFCPKSSCSPLARASPLIPLVPVWQLDPAILVVPFSSVAVPPEEVSKVSEEPEVHGLRHQWLDHVLPHAVPFLLDVHEVGHPHLHLHACLVHELDVLFFRSDMATVTCLFG